MTRNGFLFISVLLGFALLSNAKSEKNKYPVVEDEFIIKLKSSKISAKNLLSDSRIKSAEPFVTDSSLVKVKVSSHVSSKAFLQEIKENPNIEYAEPNYILKINGTTLSNGVVPNDPDFEKNWGLNNHGQMDSKGNIGVAGVDIGAPLAWQLEKGSSDIVVAVIDTGVDYNHEELKENIFINTKEIPGNNKDDDGNGFVDDVHGWNFVGKNNDPMDDQRHGTHCSGTIGAKGGNHIGTVGVSWNVRILPVKFLSAEGSGSLSDAVEGINYATLMKVNIMSNSWGGGGFSQTLFDAIKKAKDAGILFVAAAGNENADNDVNPGYPASYKVDNVISVAAIDNQDHKASFSSYGRTSVHLAAPGVNVYSTLPMGMGKYGTLSGTSMATPHVAGAAALVWSYFKSQNKSPTYAEVKERLVSTVEPSRAVKRGTISGGRLNVNNALRGIVPPRFEPDPNAWKNVITKIDSAHPYKENTNVQVVEFKHQGAKYMRVRFADMDVESGYDFVRVLDGKDQAVEEITGQRQGYVTDYIEGDTVRVFLKSDNTINGHGFTIDQYEFID